MAKNILGLDLGTNSIGWALIQKQETEASGKILGSGSRIIPMSQDVLDNFGSGVSVSQTAERTGFRGTRRLRERSLLRRERLHRVLNILGFLPQHYASEIDFEKRLGKFLPNTEPKLAYQFNDKTGKGNFIFKKSFNEMVSDFKKHQPQLLTDGKKIPYDWTIYYLRKKALTQKIEREELAWLLLHFNQKRGYYQIRGEEEEDNPNKLVEFHTLKVIDVIADEAKKGKDEIWYSIVLENGWTYRRSSKVPLFEWTGKTQEFIVSTDLNDDKSIKTDKEGKEKRSFKAVDSEKDWVAIKKSTEEKIERSKKTVGEYIYDALLQKPNQKIRGKLVRTIERKFYKDELKRILEKQQELHAQLKDKQLYSACLEELYEYNESHKRSIGERGFAYLFLNDILFYQRPLKSKKSLIGNCKFETRTYLKEGTRQNEPLKGIAKSHPLFQEFRLWKFIQNLRIYQKEKKIDSKLFTDVDVTSEFFTNTEDWIALYKWLSERREIDQKSFLKYPAFKLKKNAELYRWNYVEEKTYPCNETRSLIVSRLEKAQSVPPNFLTQEREEALWHILYSVEDKIELEKALKTFATKHDLSEDFVDLFRKFPPLKKEYGAYSAKAIKKLLPLMRGGGYWSEEKIHPQTRIRIEKIINGEYDEKIKDRLREKVIDLTTIEHFQGLPEWLASYIVYDRHSEDSDTKKWALPNDIELIEQHSLRNPIVEQLINESLQVVRDIWEYYGNGAANFFDEIHVELGREMKNTKTDREKITKQVQENESTNLRMKALLIELLNDSDFENVRPYSPMQQEILKIYEEGVLGAEDGKIPDDILRISKQAQPTTVELTRYKLWLEQKYRSPYTGEPIPLSKLFTPAYEIEHIIPQARYFDDSFSNKVICESAVNKLKDNRLGMEFIQKEEGRIIEVGLGKKVKIFTVAEYEDFVKEHYRKIRGKMKRLLMEEVPDSFIQRQLNDTRYITRVVKGLLSNIVREKNELEATSKNVIATNGTITSTLKQEWGLNDVWNELITPRFERLNSLTNSNNFGEWTSKEGKKIFQTKVPLAAQRGFNKKRIDHRHHALDAIVIACTTRDHVNYLNNESALGKKSRDEKNKKRYDLRSKLCTKKYNDDTRENYRWTFNKPWRTLTEDTRDSLQDIIISFKQSQRVINKTMNYYYKWVDDNGVKTKKLVKQTNGDHWAVRKPMHKDTVAGLVKLRFEKIISLSNALDEWKMIVDKDLKEYIKQLTEEGLDKKKIIKHFKENDNQFNQKDISRVKTYYWDIDDEGQGNNVASRTKIDESFFSETIKSITDTGIQRIMLKHLEKYNEDKGGKIIEHPEIAFSPDGLDEMNKNINELNGGKRHQPIHKIRTFEPKGNKFKVGSTGNKKDKYVEAAKGTNLFFAIYRDETGKRSYDTIPLNMVIERQKQNLSAVPEKNEDGHDLLFYLSPNDLVYVFSNDEKDSENSFTPGKITTFQKRNIYRIISFTGNRLSALPCTVAKSIVDKVEFTQLNKVEFSMEKLSIKDHCIKLKIDRLGNLKLG